MLKPFVWGRQREMPRTLPRLPGEAHVRGFRPADLPAVRRLYREGLSAAEARLNDAAGEPADFAVACLVRPHDRFWVVEAAEQLVGTIALTIDAHQVGHLRQLRVAPHWHGSGDVIALLIEAATAHAREHSCLKLVLHTPLQHERAVELLHRMGFEFSRRRDMGRGCLLEFYLNLYTPPLRADHSEGQGPWL